MQTIEFQKENTTVSHFSKRQVCIANAMSVDVEDYFQTEAMTEAIPRSQWGAMPSRVEQNVRQLYDLFQEYGVRATFFFLGWVAERFPSLVREAHELGHEIGCHSYWHRPIYSLRPEEFRDDTIRAKTVIEDAAGIQVFGYRAPSFSLTPGTEWAGEILEEAGFSYDSSVHPVMHDLYDNRNAPRNPQRLGDTSLVEIPISTVRIGKRNLGFSGGGYFRLLPYSYVRWSFGQVCRKESRPVLFYLHPWEIDPAQPRLAASRRSRLRQYIGLGRTASNLRRLVSEFQFVPIKEAFARNLSESKVAVHNAMTSSTVSAVL